MENCSTIYEHLMPPKSDIFVNDLRPHRLSHNYIYSCNLTNWIIPIISLAHRGNDDSKIPFTPTVANFAKTLSCVI